MPYASSSPVSLIDLHPTEADLREEVIAGLSQPHKQLPYKLLYDQRGSELFDQICEQPEYYITRTELSIMRERSGEMAQALGPDCLLIEYGSGSSVKIRLLLDEMEHPAAYVPIDISREHLMRSAHRLAEQYPDLRIMPVCGDYTSPIDLPHDDRAARRAVYFPGSTIGNFEPDEAKSFLKRIARLCGEGGGLIVGVDLRKDPELLNGAYNDAQGVTAAFTLNALHRLNHEFGADFALDAWRHHAAYQPERGRVEIHLLSRRDQVAHINDHTFHFQRGEMINTEFSYKYTFEGFRQLAGDAGFAPQRLWTDEKQLFSIWYMVVRQPV